MFEATVEEGLVLRLLEPRHAGALFGLIDRNRESLGYWFPWAEGTKSAADSGAFIRLQLQGFAQGEGFQLGIWLEGEYVVTSGLASSHRSFAVPRSVIGSLPSTGGEAS